MCILQSPSHIFNQFETFEMLPTWGNHDLLIHSYGASFNGLMANLPVANWATMILEYAACMRYDNLIINKT